jgi:transposase
MASKAKQIEQVAIVHPNAGGLDIGAREIWVSAPPGMDGIEQVRCYGTFTPDLHRLADWLVENGVATVAMESTGVYWIPIFEILEARGVTVYLVNARHAKNVPGRKSDYRACQWLRKLHAMGLLNASFRPDAEMCQLRTYLRHRAQLIEHRSPHILHMQKALQQMNIQIAQVLSDITGETGIAILRAIVAGERNGVKLAQLRNPHCKSPEETIAKALTGDWKDEQVFVLKQSLEFFDFYTTQLLACDAKVQELFATMKPRWDSDTQPQPIKRKRRSKNAAAFDGQAQILRLTGVDLAAVSGLNATSAQTILSEIGTDMSRWPTLKHFASWLGLAPHNDISGGRVLRSCTLPTNNRAGQAFRQAAASVARSSSAFGAYYRRKKAQGGPLFAQVATAHKIARTVYHLEHVRKGQRRAKRRVIIKDMVA